MLRISVGLVCFPNNIAVMVSIQRWKLLGGTLNEVKLDLAIMAVVKMMSW